MGLINIIAWSTQTTGVSSYGGHTCPTFPIDIRTGSNMTSLANFSTRFWNVALNKSAKDVIIVEY